MKDKVLLAKEHEAGFTPAEAAEALARAAVDGGELALKMRRTGVRTWTKHHDSPVTEADLAVDALLRKRLMAAAPSYGWLSEESTAHLGDPAHSRRWVVDPIDGTRSFIKQLPDWSISLALVENGRPLAAVIYAPVTEELFVAIAGAGAKRNGIPIATTSLREFAAARIAGPNSTLERITRAGIPFEPVPRIHSLALRFARVAAGDIDVAMASKNSRDWDLAAADLLVHEAGGALTSLEGTRLTYDRPDAEHPTLAAAGKALHAALLAVLNRGSVSGTGTTEAVTS